MIAQIRDYLHKHLTISEVRTPKYYLGIKFVYQLRLAINQKKHVLDIIEET